MESDRFEIGILRMVTIVGFIRSLIFLAGDNPPATGWNDFFLDIGIAAIFLFALVLTHRTRILYSWLIPLFFLPSILILVLYVIDARGLASTGEINAFAMIVVVCLTMRKKLPQHFSAITILGVVFALVVVEYQNGFSQDFSSYGTNTFSTLFISLAIILLLNYAKNFFDNQHASVIAQRKRLRKTRKEIKRRRKELQKQNLALRNLKSSLEDKVIERTSEIQKQNEHIEEYLELTFNELLNKYQQAIKEIENIPSQTNNELTHRIRASGNVLKMEMTELQRKIGVA